MRPPVLLGCAVALPLVCTGCTGSGAARRPPPATIANTPGPEPAVADRGACDDPIEGTWRARVYRAEVGKLDEVTLTIERVGLAELRGRIVVETWDADDRDADPPPCPDGAPALTRVVQMASGAIHGIEVDISGSDPERTQFTCDIENAATYNADHFTGELDDQTLVTTNDDGGIDQGRPHVFTRTSCQAQR